jgi:hypothetical protein
MGWRSWKRPRFRFHLSTAVVGVLVLGVLLWQNIGLYSFDFYGWPIPMFGYEFTYLDLTSGYHVSPTDFNPIRLILNLLICGAVVYMVAVTNEEAICQSKRSLQLRTYLVLILVGIFEIWWDRRYPLHYFFVSDNITPFVQRAFTIVIEMFIARFASEHLDRIWPRLHKLTAWKRPVQKL